MRISDPFPADRPVRSCTRRAASAIDSPVGVGPASDSTWLVWIPTSGG